MKFVIKLILSAISILLASYLLDGVRVDDFFNALVLAALLALLNVTLKPLLIILTIPVTLLTLGLFLLVINALMVMLAGSLIPGVSVAGFWSALFFSILVSLFTWMLEGITREHEKKN